MHAVKQAALVVGRVLAGVGVLVLGPTGLFGPVKLTTSKSNSLTLVVPQDKRKAIQADKLFIDTNLGKPLFRVLSLRGDFFEELIPRRNANTQLKGDSVLQAAFASLCECNLRVALEKALKGLIRAIYQLMKTLKAL